MGNAGFFEDMKWQLANRHSKPSTKVDMQKIRGIMDLGLGMCFSVNGSWESETFLIFARSAFFAPELNKDLPSFLTETSLP